jgi:ribosomal protein S18 acetylase RimI-like enzyme
MVEKSASADAAKASLRAVSPEDESFLYTVYASTRAAEMMLLPWSVEQKEAFLRMQFNAQQNYYRAENPEATHDIILQDSLPVGRLYVARRESEIRILDVTILPEYRSRGLGTPLIKDLMEEAAGAGKSLSVYVESFNPSRNLFERLGFTKVSDDGVNCLMEWRPGSTASDG